MPFAVARFQGVFELVGLGCFLYGYFADVASVMFVGGVLVVLDDVIQILTGVLNPIVPLMLTIVLGIAFTPWYVGVFWASAAFKVLGIPGSFLKIFAPRQIFQPGGIE